MRSLLERCGDRLEELTAGDMLSTMEGATADPVLYAVDQGWLELEGAHSACLAEEGRGLIAREVN
jgi:hypothetical protein